MLIDTKATTTKLVEQLYELPENGKAEIIDGEVIPMSPTGGRPGRIGGKIYIYLDQYEQETGRGYAFPDNVGFLVHLPHRDSFSPDAAFYVGDLINDDFLEGAPIFAVEVRSKNDYGPAAEQAIREKIADYFLSGTQIVWDVDTRRQVIRVYRSPIVDSFTTYTRQEIAEAEPALPGWRLPLATLFNNG